MTEELDVNDDRPSIAARRRRAKLKLLIAIALDLVDFTVGRIFGVGLVSNALLTLVGVWMFGWRGLLHALEFLDPTHQIDGFVPTLTLIALAELRAID